MIDKVVKFVKEVLDRISPAIATGIMLCLVLLVLYQIFGVL